MARRQMAVDSQGLLSRWRELDRLDAEIVRKRAELQVLESRILSAHERTDQPGRQTRPPKGRTLGSRPGPGD